MFKFSNVICNKFFKITCLLYFIIITLEGKNSSTNAKVYICSQLYKKTLENPLNYLKTYVL